MQFERAGGILLHPSSLPGPYGIGDLGPRAHRFVDWLADSGCRLWQVLPLGPTGYGNSPYQCHSVFAGNPYLISPELLVHDGLLTEDDVEPKALLQTSESQASGRVNFELIIPSKKSLLKRAYERFRLQDPEKLREQFSLFRAANAVWLEDFALFMAIKEFQGGGSWNHWPAPIRGRHEAAISEIRQHLGEAVARVAFYQFLFFRQWAALRDHAHARAIQIIGDIPIFAALDSADVWVHPELFCVDIEGNPTVVAGVPPDYFSPTGQLWGNPHYRWETHKRDAYAWWRERLRAMRNIVDVIRIDHFRGFSAYWEIPAGNPTAEVGRWVPGPADDLFDALREDLGGSSRDQPLPVVAEDLGVITPDVVRLRDKYGLPGMKILQFGFSGPENGFLPHNYVRQCVAYTGTHDNDTARGWYSQAPREETTFARHYLHTTAASFPWGMIRALWSSVAVFAIAPMQDLLGLGAEARMNYPGHPQGNWEWRMHEADLSDPLARKMAQLNRLYGR